MSKRSPSVIVGDILRCIEHVESYTKALTFDDFSSNFMVIEACLYNIQVIGEAVNQLADAVKAANQQVPWNLIKGMRNRLIHEYFGTDLPLVWNVITDDLPGLKSELKAILRKLQVENR
ncbi:MAG: DUF86 domain-containing protein [Bacteroidetes bacterium]|nr:DUF86 domain-containing protein [Bacteroidota bacterium]